MYSRNNQNDNERVSRSTRPVFVARRQRQLRPFLFHMGPVALSITSVLLIALMAVLYLSQQGQAVAANQKLQNMRNQEAQLQRQKQDLLDSIAQERSPAYITEHAKELGLVPADPKHIRVIKVQNLQPIVTSDEDNQP
ncbi:MAG: septum formation initiator family protein [Ktedonobacteraceae bacterium]|nr:septum formation initiator family protein [Ktedonobacteraceae bacterium]